MIFINELHKEMTKVKNVRLIWEKLSLSRFILYLGLEIEIVIYNKGATSYNIHHMFSLLEKFELHQFFLKIMHENPHVI